MLSDCPETTKNILDIIYGDEGEGNGISTMFIRLAEQDKSTTLDRIGDIIGTGYTPNIDPDKEEHNLPETEKYF